MLGLIICAAVLATPSHSRSLQQPSTRCSDTTEWYVYPGSDTTVNGQSATAGQEFVGSTTIVTLTQDAQVYTYVGDSITGTWVMLNVFGSATTTRLLGHQGVGTTATLSQDTTDTDDFDAQFDFLDGGVWVDDASYAPSFLAMKRQQHLDRLRKHGGHFMRRKSGSGTLQRFRVRRGNKGTGPTTFAGYGTQYQLLNLGSGKFLFEVDKGDDGAQILWQDDYDGGIVYPYPDPTWAKDISADILGKHPTIQNDPNPNPPGMFPWRRHHSD